MRDFFRDMWYYFTMLFDSFTFKAAFGACGVFYTTCLGGNAEIFLIFCVMLVADLFSGAYAAHICNEFDWDEIYKWLRKTLLYLIVVLLFGITFRGFRISTSLAAPLLDFFLSLMIATELRSVLKNLLKANLPVPFAALWISAKMEKRMKDKMTCGLNSLTDGDDQNDN